MPGFFRKLFGLKPKPKATIPNFKNAEEYFEWRHKTYNEPLPLSIIKSRLEIKERIEREKLERQTIMDGARDRQARKNEAKAAQVAAQKTAGPIKKN